jgi:tight adherence protein C
MTVGYEAFRYAFVGAISIAILEVVYAMASAPTRVASRLGMRGLKRQRAFENNPAWQQIEPLVRWLGVRVSGVLSENFRARASRQLELAGDYLGLTPDEYVALSLLSFAGGLVFGAVAGKLTGTGVIMVLIVGPIGAALPYLTVASEVDRRFKQINRGLPYAIDLLALSMSAGQDFPGAMRQVVEKSSDPDDALVEEFGRMLQELGLGKTRRNVLMAFAERVPTESVGEFVNAVVQAEERGNPVAEVLQIQAGVSRMRRSTKAEEAAAKAGVAMVGPLFLLFFCIMLLIMGPIMLSISKVLG